MTTITLTPEQYQVVEQAGAQPVRVADPTGRRLYLLVEEGSRGSRSPTEEAQPSPLFDIPEGIRRSQAAFLRDLPELLKDKSSRGQWVIYNGDERIGIGPVDETLLRECSRRGLERDQYEIFVIEETEEVDYPSSWM